VIEELPTGSLEFVHQNAESEALAEEYIRQSVVSRRMLADAQHIAVATVARVDVRIQRCQSSFGLSAVGDSIAPGGVER